MVEPPPNAVDAPASPQRPFLHRLLSVRTFTIVSLIHCVFFTGLMICVLIPGTQQPATFIFGFTHGVLYMVVVAACIVAAKIGTLSITTALIVAIIGAFGPYVGAFELVREWRRQGRREPALGGA